MNCRETTSLLPLFVDGELDARQMRDVALHSARCVACETELRGLENLHDLVAGYVAEEVDRIDTNAIWREVAARMGDVRVPWWVRAREWLAINDEAPWRAPAYAALAAVMVFAVLLWRPGQDPAGGPVLVASEPIIDNSVILDSVQSDAASLALLSDPMTNTTVLWVGDEIETVSFRPGTGFGGVR